MTKKLGIIGGAGSFASALFYETLVRESFCLKLKLPEVILIDHRFPSFEEMTRGENKAEVLQRELAECLKMLAACQVDAVMLICNTLHIYLLSLPNQSIPILSVPQFVLQDIEKNGKQKLLLLGTSDTYNSTLYKPENQILMVPSQIQQQMVEDAIQHGLVGDVLREDAMRLAEIIESFSGTIDGVILACTELPVLHHHYPLTTRYPVYDSIKVPAKSVLQLLNKST